MDSLIGWPLVLLSTGVYFVGKKLHTRYFPQNILPKPAGFGGLSKGLKIEIRHSRLVSIQTLQDSSHSGLIAELPEKSGFFASSDSIPLIPNLVFEDRRELVDQFTDHKQRDWIYKISMEKTRDTKTGLQSVSPKNKNFDAYLKLDQKLKRKDLPKILDLGSINIDVSILETSGVTNPLRNWWPENIILFVMGENGVYPAILLYPNHQEVPSEALGLERSPFYEQFLKSCCEACRADAEYVENTPDLWNKVVGVLQVCSNSPGVLTVTSVKGAAAAESDGTQKTTYWQSSPDQVDQFRQIVLLKVLNRFSSSI